MRIEITVGFPVRPPLVEAGVCWEASRGEKQGWAERMSLRLPASLLGKLFSSEADVSLCSPLLACKKFGFQDLCKDTPLLSPDALPFGARYAFSLAMTKGFFCQRSLFIQLHMALCFVFIN